MKKYTLTHLGIVAGVSLVAGLLIGIAFFSSSNSSDLLSGSIGKVDRYRNVQVTEEDILLRNELTEDTTKRSQYEKYLTFYYYQSVKTANDVDNVLQLTSVVPEFSSINEMYKGRLEKAGTSIEKARLDILNALNMLLLIDEQPNIPVIDYLNKANNGVARLKSYDELLLDFMNTIAIFMEGHRSGDFPELQDAHDILALNVIQSAILTQNKPVLNYLDKKKLMNDKEGIKELMGSVVINSFSNQVLQDIESLNAIGSAQNLGATINSQELQGIVIGSLEKLNVVNSFVSSQEQLGSIGSFINSSVLGNQQLQGLVINSQSLNAGFSSQSLNVVYY